MPQITPTAETYDHTSAKWKCSDFYTEGNPQSFFELETSGYWYFVRDRLGRDP